MKNAAKKKLNEKVSLVTQPDSLPGSTRTPPLPAGASSSLLSTQEEGHVAISMERIPNENTQLLVTQPRIPNSSSVAPVAADPASEEIMAIKSFRKEIFAALLKLVIPTALGAGAGWIAGSFLGTFLENKAYYKSTDGNYADFAWIGRTTAAIFAVFFGLVGLAVGVAWVLHDSKKYAKANLEKTKEKMAGLKKNAEEKETELNNVIQKNKIELDNVVEELDNVVEEIVDLEPKIILLRSLGELENILNSLILIYPGIEQNHPITRGQIKDISKKIQDVKFPPDFLVDSKIPTLPILTILSSLNIDDQSQKITHDKFASLIFEVAFLRAKLENNKETLSAEEKEKIEIDCKSKLWKSSPVERNNDYHGDFFGNVEDWGLNLQEHEKIGVGFLLPCLTDSFKWNSRQELVDKAKEIVSEGMNSNMSKDEQNSFLFLQYLTIRKATDPEKMNNNFLMRSRDLRENQGFELKYFRDLLSSFSRDTNIDQAMDNLIKAIMIVNDQPGEDIKESLMEAFITQQQEAAARQAEIESSNKGSSAQSDPKNALASLVGLFSNGVVRGQVRHMNDTGQLLPVESITETGSSSSSSSSSR